ncbi:hypothetical protein M422DRAFT_111326, partial [Sphaerobolus stellatus SS14]
KSFYYVPSFRRAFHFVDRKGVQDTLDDMFNQPSGSMKTTIVSLIGMGGAGKTQIALDRYHGLQELGHYYELQEMDKSEGLTLLLGQQGAEENEVLGEQIIELLGQLPLAIDQARAYISQRRLALQEFITEFNIRKADLFKDTPHLWQYQKKSLIGEENMVLNVGTTWEMSLSLLNE